MFRDWTFAASSTIKRRHFLVVFVVEFNALFIARRDPIILIMMSCYPIN